MSNLGTLQLLLERAICDAIQDRSYSATLAQVVPFHQIDAAAVLPRVVVKADQQEGSHLFQVGVYEFAITAEVHVDAGDRDGRDMLAALSNAVDDAFDDPDSASLITNSVVLVYGFIPGSANEENDQEKQIRTRSGTAHATLLI